MRTLSLILFTASVVTAAPAFCQDPAEAPIREAVQKYVAAFNAGDADAAAATYAPDATHTYALGFTHRGRVEIAGGLRELFAGPMKGAKISITTLRVRSLAPTIAVEEEAFSLKGLVSPDGRRLPPVEGLCLAVHERRGRQWQAAAVQCLVPPPSESLK